MNSALSRICRGYSESELELLTDFLRRTITAGRVVTDDLASRESDLGQTPRD
jgi:hypothetical protein